MRVSEAKYQQIALADQEGQWELYCGHLRKKPDMTFEHNHIARTLGFLLQAQLGLGEFDVAVNTGRTRRTARHYFIPDVMVIPLHLADPLRGRLDILEAYNDPLPLVVEVWSRLTGTYDLETKLPVYMQRGDLEIWRLHPYEKTLTAWRRQPDGSYQETQSTGGVVSLAALPQVGIDLDALFSS